MPVTPRKAEIAPARAPLVPPEPGDDLILRATEERVRVLAVLDAAGTLLVQAHADGDADAPFQVSRDEVMTLRERHGGCGCCG